MYSLEVTCKVNSSPACACSGGDNGGWALQFSCSISSIQCNPRFRDQRKPLLLEKNGGELRTRRIHTDASTPASSQFMLKASPKNNGSQHLVAGTEHVAPGATLPKHRHLAQEEIVLMLTRFLTVNAWF
jgi:hypothetical protein